MNLKYLNLINNAIEDESENIKNFVYFISNLSIKTRYAYVLDVINFIHFSNKKEKELCLNDFTKYMSKIQYKENGEETTSSYRIAVYSSLKKYCKFLYSTGVIATNYMDSVDRPKAIESQKTKEKRKNAYLDEKEIKQYLSNVEDRKNFKKGKPSKRWSSRDKAITKLFLSTGMRCSALVMIDVNDVNLEKGIVQVTEKGGKTNDYLLPKTTIEEIRSWINFRSEMIIEDTDALFVSKYRKRLSTTSVSDIVKKYGKDIKPLTPHKLRASYGTLLYEKTGDIYEVQKCMIHSSSKTTQLYIRDKDDKHKEKAKRIIEGII